MLVLSNTKDYKFILMFVRSMNNARVVNANHWNKKTYGKSMNLIKNADSKGFFIIFLIIIRNNDEKLPNVP